MHWTMMSTYVRKISVATLLAAAALAAFAPGVTFAQRALTLSVTPTLFEMSASPGQEWRSSVKVINSNPYDLTVYASAVNFAPQGEAGRGKLLPVFEAMTEGTTLGEWIDLSSEPITIPRETSYEVPFTVTVPEEAAPGGHFAAILVGTQPPKSDDVVAVRTSQVVTSLFFVRIAGEVIENGSIREFRAIDGFQTAPAAEFELRFENEGNVHLQPQGDITIYNMWGEERGVIPINHQTNFGNVLPESIRKFSFTWEGERSFTEVGRFRAVATLAYGEDDRQFTTRSTVFWVVPVKEVAVTLLALAAIVFTISRIVRAYIRRMLMLSGIDPDAPRRRARVAREDDVRIASYRRIGAPVRSGYDDLRGRLSEGRGLGSRLRSLGGFAYAYRYFFTSATFLLAVIAGGAWYVTQATVDDRSYNVTIDTGGETVEISSEEVLYERRYEDRGSTRPSNELAVASSTELRTVEIVNISGTPGTAAAAKKLLEDAGYEVLKTSVDLERAEERSIVVFSLDRQDDAIAVSKLLGGALLSAGPAASTDTVTIFVGLDQLAE